MRQAMTRIGFAATIGLCLAAALPGDAMARDCGRTDVPPGVRVTLPQGCKPEKRPDPKPSGVPAVRPGAPPGFIDLGNGSQVRISGQVRMDVRTRP
jgi:hypothetical protein